MLLKRIKFIFYPEYPGITEKEATVTGVPKGKGMRLANAGALCTWYAATEAAGASDAQEARGMGARWGMAFSLGLHAVVIGLTLTLSVSGIQATTAPPPVVLDVVFGAPGGDGTPGDGAPGKEGAAGGSGPGPRMEAAAPVPQPEPPRPKAVVAVKPVSPPRPVHRVRKRHRKRSRPKPASVSPLARSTVAPVETADSDRGGRDATGAVVASTGGTAGGGGGNGGGGGVGPGHGKGGRGDGPGAGGHGGGAFEGLFGSGNGPTFARRVPPKYPPQARRFGREGVVVLRLVIDAAGTLTKVEVVKKGGAGFDKAALAAIRASTYHPARLHGHAVASRAVLRVRFQLAGT